MHDHRSGRDNGYVLANDANATLGTAYTPASIERHNSDGGTVHVTASHTTSKRCEVTSWTSTIAGIGGATSDLLAHVACHTAAGVASNAKFVLQFTE